MKTLLTLVAVAFTFSIANTFAGDCGGCTGTKDGSKDKKKDSAMISLKF